MLYFKVNQGFKSNFTVIQRLCIRIYIVVRMYITVKGMSRWMIQKINAMLLCIEYGILFVDTVDMTNKACSALNAMFVETLDTLVFVALTQHLIQSSMRCKNSTLLYSTLTPPREKVSNVPSALWV